MAKKLLLVLNEIISLEAIIYFLP